MCTNPTSVVTVHVEYLRRMDITYRTVAQQPNTIRIQHSPALQPQPTATIPPTT